MVFCWIALPLNFISIFIFSWDDDVVFRNQSRGEPKAAKRFINDTIRSDFHRKFLNKYIK